MKIKTREIFKSVLTKVRPTAPVLLLFATCFCAGIFLASGGGSSFAEGEDLAHTTIPSTCFEAGTKIHTKDGLTNIEDVKKGDLVLSYDETDGINRFAEVLDTTKGHSEELYTIKTSTQAMRVTGEHSLYNASSKRYEQVNRLSAEDLLLDKDGNTVKIISIKKQEKETDVYNLHVDEYNNYYVTEVGYLSYNINLPDENGKTTIRLNLQKNEDGSKTVTLPISQILNEDTTPAKSDHFDYELASTDGGAVPLPDGSLGKDYSFSLSGMEEKELSLTFLTDGKYEYDLNSINEFDQEKLLYNIQVLLSEEDNLARATLTTSDWMINKIKIRPKYTGATLIPDTSSLTVSKAVEGDPSTDYFPFIIEFDTPFYDEEDVNSNNFINLPATVTPAEAYTETFPANSFASAKMQLKATVLDSGFNNEELASFEVDGVPPYRDFMLYRLADVSLTSGEPVVMGSFYDILNDNITAEEVSNAIEGERIRADMVENSGGNGRISFYGVDPGIYLLATENFCDAEYCYSFTPQYITLPAYGSEEDYINRTLVQTPLGVKDDSNTIRSNIFTFSLRAGDKVEINIPEGVSYKVTEVQPSDSYVYRSWFNPAFTIDMTDYNLRGWQVPSSDSDWELKSITGDAVGTMEEGEKKDVLFTNKEVVTHKLTIKKETVNNEAGEFEFKVKLRKLIDYPVTFSMPVYEKWPSVLIADDSSSIVWNLYYRSIQWDENSTSYEPVGDYSLHKSIVTNSGNGIHELYLDYEEMTDWYSKIVYDTILFEGEEIQRPLTELYVSFTKDGVESNKLVYGRDREWTSIGMNRIATDTFLLREPSSTLSNLPSEFGALDSDGYYHFTLSNGEQVVIPDIPVGCEYEVIETSQEGWMQKESKNASGTLTEDTTATFLNEKEQEDYNLTVRKQVRGDMGDTDKLFEFELELWQKNEDMMVPIALGNVAGLTKVEDGKYKFTLKHNDSIDISNIPEGTEYIITELGSDHTASFEYSVGGGAMTTGGSSAKNEDLTTGEMTLSDDTEVLFTNTREGTTTTGVTMNERAYFLLVMITGLAIITLTTLRGARWAYRRSRL